MYCYTSFQDAILNGAIVSHLRSIQSCHDGIIDGKKIFVANVIIIRQVVHKLFGGDKYLGSTRNSRRKFYE
jgi:hypothetical protein